MSKRLVLAGAGHAHLETLLHLEDFVREGAKVRVISAGSKHYYSGMGPGLLAGRYRPRETFFNIAAMVQERGGTFVEDRVVRIDPVRQVLHLASGEEEPYDLLSLNLGSAVALPEQVALAEGVYPVKPIDQLLVARKVALADQAPAPSWAVVGGGPAGVELACALRQLSRDEEIGAKVHLICRRSLLPEAPLPVQTLAKQILKKRGVDLIENNPLQRAEGHALTLKSGLRIPSRLTLLATGVRPSPVFQASGLKTGPSGGLLVDDCLRALGWRNIFAGGDCIDFDPQPLDKVGVYAVRQNPVLRYNLMRVLRGDGALRSFQPQRSYLLILNLGDSEGLLWKGERVHSGRAAFRLKDYIDRRFMRRFQVSGEQDEV